MKLDKGLYQDCTPEEQPDGTYRWAMNWLSTETLGSLTTEYSSIPVTVSLTGTIIGTIPTPTQVIIFSVTDSGNSEIGVYSEKLDTYVPVLNNTIVTALSPNPDLGTGLNFQTDRQISGIYRYNSFGEIEVVFTDNYNSPKLITIPNVDLGGGNAVMLKYYSSYTVNQINLFQKITNTDATTTIIAGGSLPADTYISFFRYKNKDGSGTGYYSFGVPIYINSLSVGVNQTYNLKTGSKIGDITNKAIVFDFTIVDGSFAYIEYGLYRVSTSELLLLGEINSLASKTTIYSLLDSVTVSGGLSNLLANIYNYNTVKTITSLNQQLYLGGLTSDQLVLPQRWANTVNIKWHCKWLDFASSAIDLKDPNTVYKTFQAGETYSFFIRGVKNGTPSNWCHIAGRKSKTNLAIQRNVNRVGDQFTYSVTNEKQAVDTIQANGLNGAVLTDTNGVLNNAIQIQATAPFYSLFDSIDFSAIDTEDDDSDENKGEFCFWENQNEVYSTYYNADDLLIGNSGINLNAVGNENVRHHKFPSFATLQKLKNKYSWEGGTERTRYDFTSESSSINKYAKFSRTFCSVIPQLGVAIDLSGIDSSVSDLFDYFEIGYNIRSSDNSTIIGNDIALFGQYRPSTQGFAETGVNYLPSTTDTQKENATLFTGGNFNNLTGNVGMRGDTNGSWYRNKDGSTIEQLPNRLHIHTPDLVDQVDFNNDATGILTQYVENELLMSVSNPDNDGDFNLASPPRRWMMGRISNFSQQVSYYGLGTGNNSFFNFSNRLYFYLFDYTVSSKNSIKSNFESISSQEYVARSDNWYPDAYKKQKVSNNVSYIPANVGNIEINGITVEQGVDSPLGITGSSNHLHLVFPEGSLRPTSFSTTSSVGDPVWAKKSVIGEPICEINWAAAGNPSRPSKFMRKCVNEYDNGNVTGGSQRIFLGGDMQHNTFLTTLRKYKTDMYPSFFNVDILKTESKLTALSNDTVFYGDMFLSDVNYIVRGNSSAIGRTSNVGNVEPYKYPQHNTCVYRYIAPTKKNLNHRRSEVDTLTEINSFYPLSRINFTTNEETKALYYMYGERATDTFKPQALLLESEYNTQNDKSFITDVYKKDLLFLNKFPYRILQSLTQSSESSISNWRSFPAGNYYEVDKTKGFIVNLQYYDDVLLIHTNLTLLQTRGVGKLETGVASINIGTGGVFDYPPQDVQFDRLGYVGTLHQQSCALTPFGYVFADITRGKVFIYRKGEKPLEISSLGMFKYFRDYLNTSVNDFNAGLSEIHTYFDYKYNRMLMTCKGDGDEIDPFTISFDGTKWTSFHSYIPDIATNTATNTYSIFKDKLFKHNSIESVLSFGTEDGLVNYQAEIDFTSNTAEVMSKGGTSGYGMRDDLKSFQSFSWRNQSHDLTNSNKLIHNNTVDYAQVYNDHQLSQKITLSSDLTTNNFNVRQFSGMWNFNKFRDSLDRITAPANNYVIPTFITNANKKYRLDDTKINPIFVKRFVDRYAILRLTVNHGTRLLKLIAIESNFKKVIK